MKLYRKLLAVGLVLASLVCLTLGLTACGDDDNSGGEDPHTHTFEDTWTSVADGHYKKSTCGHSDSETVIAHADGNSDGKCDVCDYSMNTDGSTVYTVTVLDTNGDPVIGATVALVQFSGTETATTDKYGRATFEVTNAAYVAAKVTAVPAGYEAPASTADTAFPSGVTTLTFSDIKKLVEYTFIVLDLDGYGIEGADVQICTGEDCRPGTTDKDGRFTTYISAEKAAADGVKAKILTLPAGYVNAEGVDVPFDYVYFADGETELVAYATEMASYSVTVTDLFGKVYSGVSVELYGTDGELVASATTNDRGFCEFFVPESTYTVEVAHPNAAFEWTNSGSKTLTPANKTYVANLVENTGLVSYIFTIKNPDGNLATDAAVFLFGKDGEYVGAYSVNSMGMCVLNLYNGDYIVTAFNSSGNYIYFELEKDGASTLDIAIPDNVRGSSKESAITVYNLVELPCDENFIATLSLKPDYAFEQGESLWIKIPYARNKVFTIDGEKFDVEYDGNAVPTGEDGRVSITFDVPLGETVYLKLTAKEAVTEDITFTAPGSAYTPIIVSYTEISGYVKTLNLEAGETVYFKASGRLENGTLTVTSDKDALISIDGGAASRPIGFNVNTVVAVTALADGELTVTFTYTEVKRDYKAVLKGASEGADLSGITLTLYKFIDDSYEEVATAVTNDLGEATFADVYAREDYYIAVTHAELVKEYVKVELTDEPTALFVAHVKDGTSQYPYAVELGENALSFTDAGTVWFEFNIVGSSSYTFTVPNGVETAIYALGEDGYVQLSADGENTFAANGIDASTPGVYVFSDTDNYRFAFTASAAAETAFTVVSNAKTRENAVSVDSLGDVTVTVAKGETDYYRLNLEGTVTVTAPDGARLSKITVTELGEVTENIDSKSFTVTLGANSEVYFRISAESDGEYTVTVSES